MKHVLKFIVIFVLFGRIGFAQITDTLTGDITTLKTLNSSKKYLLLGECRIQSGGALVIPAGTRIFGDKPSKGSKIVFRG